MKRYFITYRLHFFLIWLPLHLLPSTCKVGCEMSHKRGYWLSRLYVLLANNTFVNVMHHCTVCHMTMLVCTSVPKISTIAWCNLRAHYTNGIMRKRRGDLDLKPRLSNFFLQHRCVALSYAGKPQFQTFITFKLLTYKNRLFLDTSSIDDIEK